MNFDLITKHIVPKFVIDIGARLGDWAKEAKAAWPDAEFFLIEGNFECKDALDQSGFRTFIAVISDKDHERVNFYTLRDCATATGCSYYRENTPFFEGDKAVATEKKTITLDELFQTRFLETALYSEPMLIKIDTQGSELDILNGAEKTLPRVTAVILELSRVEYNIGAPLCDEVDEYMRSKGFEPREVLGDIVHVTSRDVIQNDVLYMRK